MGQLSLLGNESVAINQDERAFFEQLGARIAELRKAQGITQVQLAELLGVSQQTINAYEVGRRRMAISALPKLARMLGVAMEDLIGQEQRPSKRGPVPKLQQQIDRITQLPRTQQKFVMQMIDTVLAQASR